MTVTRALCSCISLSRCRRRWRARPPNTYRRRGADGRASAAGVADACVLPDGRAARQGEGATPRPRSRLG